MAQRGAVSINTVNTTVHFRCTYLETIIYSKHQIDDHHGMGFVETIFAGFA